MGALLILLVGACLPTLALAQDGTASLTGKVRAITGIGVAGTNMELTSEKSPSTVFRTATDQSGVYRFSSLPPDDYTLKLDQPGFRVLTVKAIHIASAEQESMPDLELEVKMFCGDRVLDHLQFLPFGSRTGNLMGRVRMPEGPGVADSRPVPGADVSLICSVDTPCSATKTDSSGEFTFKETSSGDFRIRVNHEGFYPLEQIGYRTQAGFETIFLPMYLELCPRGNCDPKRRPKKPLRTCE